MESGKGWAWVAPQLPDARNWRRCEIWAAVEFRSVWITKQGFGLRGNFTEMIIRERPQQAHGLAYSEEACRQLLGLGRAQA